MGAVTVGNIEVTSSGKGLIVDLDVNMVQSLTGYTTKSGEERCNVIVDMKDLISLLNENQPFAPLIGFNETVAVSKKETKEELGKISKDASPEEKAEAPVIQYEDVHEEKEEVQG